MCRERERKKMEKKRERNSNSNSNSNSRNEEESSGGYEEMRQKRMKENMERMHKLGILDLAKTITKKQPQPAAIKNNIPTIQLKPHLHPPRRSSRLVTSAPVSYSEKRIKIEKKEKIVEINIPEGTKPEIYTEEDEGLLGDCKEAWTLSVDGYSEDGERIYDPYNGKSCHQCRQKTLGHRTSCIMCKSVQGQFCGDCLYTRYGENVLETKQNPGWICPVCRGICNCSRCRRIKGWAPTGQLYTKITKLGFKSVAHYLIKTRRPHSDQEKLDAEIAALDSDTSAGDIPKPQPVDKDGVAPHSDDDYNEEADNKPSSGSDPDSDDGDVDYDD